MNLEQLKQHKPDILAAANQFGASRLRVFGSVARGEQNESSDIDFLVTFPGSYSLFKQRLPLARRLEEITGCTPDLIPERELSPLIKHQVLAEAIEL